MALTVDLTEAGARFVELVEHVQTYGDVIITRGGHPVARLIAAFEAGPGADRIPGSAQGLFTVPDDCDTPLEDLREFI